MQKVIQMKCSNLLIFCQVLKVISHRAFNFPQQLISFILPTLACLNFLLFSIFVKTNSEVPGIMIYEELQSNSLKLLKENQPSVLLIYVVEVSEY